jgi:adenylate kinase family enzyme
MKDLKDPREWQSPRIHVMGASGSGVTTLGRTLADRLAVAHMDTDDFYWLPSDPPYQCKRPVTDRLRLLHEALKAANGGWALSGSLDGWGDPFVPLFELVVFLLVPTDVRLQRLREREWLRYGQEALAYGGLLYEQHRAFLHWAAAYDDGTQDGRSRPRHEAWLARLPCPILRLEGVLSVEEMVRRILDPEDAIKRRSWRRVD